MAGKLKVVGWQGFRSEAPAAKCTREICAVASIAELCRKTGKKRSQFFNITETGNAREIAQAMKEPGVIFWKGINEPDRDDEVWRRVGPV